MDALARLADLPWSCVCVGASTAIRRSPSGSAAAAGRSGRVHFAGPRTGDGARRRVRRRRPAGAAVAGRDVRHGRDRGAGPRHAGGRRPRSAACRRRSAPHRTARGPALLVPPGDPAALAAALRRWLTDAGLARAAAARRPAPGGTTAGLGRRPRGRGVAGCWTGDRRVQRRPGSSCASRPTPPRARGAGRAAAPAPPRPAPLVDPRPGLRHRLDGAVARAAAARPAALGPARPRRRAAGPRRRHRAAAAEASGRPSRPGGRRHRADGRRPRRRVAGDLLGAARPAHRRGGGPARRACAAARTPGAVHAVGGRAM